MAVKVRSVSGVRLNMGPVASVTAVSTPARTTPLTGVTHTDWAPLAEAPFKGTVDTESAAIAIFFVLAPPLGPTVVTLTVAGAVVATRSSRWVNPLTEEAGRTMPASVLIGAEAAAQARSEGPPAVRRLSTITAATTGTSERT